jgi:Mor family transcriptional regulator
MDKPSENILKLIEESSLQSVRELLGVVDAETVYKLMCHFGGENIFIPKICKFEAVERNKKIREDFYSGLSHNQIAKKYGLSSRHIINIINGG